MAAEHGLILDFTTVLATSALGGYLVNRLHQPVLLGYLASGMIVGPFGFKLLSDVTMQQIPYIFGDADSELVLEKAYLKNASALAIALPDPSSTRLLLQRALKIAPSLDVIARSHYNNEIYLLTQMGAKEVVQPEFEATLELGAHLLTTLGEADEHIHNVITNIRVDRYRSIRPAHSLN